MYRVERPGVWTNLAENKIELDPITVLNRINDRLDKIEHNQSRLREDQEKIATFEAQYVEVVSRLNYIHGQLEKLVREPTPTFQCPECFQARPVTDFSDSDYICTVCRSQKSD